MNLETGRVEITCQNHGFAIAEDRLPAELEVPHRTGAEEPADVVGEVGALLPALVVRPRRVRDPL